MAFVVLGFALAVVIAWRMIWRRSGGRELSAADAGPLHVLAKATHYGWMLPEDGGRLNMVLTASAGEQRSRLFQKIIYFPSRQSRKKGPFRSSWNMSFALREMFLVGGPGIQALYF
jgi:hypothetical protein